MSLSVSHPKESIQHNSFPNSICMNLWTALNSDSDNLQRDNLSNTSQRIFTSLLTEQVLKKKNRNQMEIQRLLENLQINCEQQRSVLLDFDKEMCLEMGQNTQQFGILKQNQDIFKENVIYLEYWAKDHAGKNIIYFQNLITSISKYFNISV